jgi:alpha-beta hydrolase superfamily lysophospholipase
MNDISTLSADGTALFGYHWPAKNPKAVMSLVHGFGEHSGRYRPMAAYLNSQSIAVVSLDLRGHGKSEGRRGVVKSYDEFHADLAVLLEKTRELYPQTPQVVYGHSMGGGLVLDHGSRNLDTVPIIASAPFITLTDPIPSTLSFIVKLMGRILPRGSMTQPIDGTKISNLEDEQALYMDDPLNHGTLGFRLAEAMVNTGETLAENAENWDRPLLILHSKADQLTNYQSSEAFAKAAKQTEFQGFETPQHEMHNDLCRTEVYTRMSDFILKHAS